MEWVRQLYGTVVGLDTAPLNYFVELNPKYLPIADPFFEAVERGDIRVVTSALTLTEVPAYPFRRGSPSMAEQYSRILLNQRNLKTFPVSVGIATEAAALRADFGLMTPDSIQLATARMGGATTLLTNDTRIRPVPSVNIIVLDHILANPQLTP
jgi:predicted nucleic acid-binding protein